MEWRLLFLLSLLVGIVGVIDVDLCEWEPFDGLCCCWYQLFGLLVLGKVLLWGFNMNSCCIFVKYMAVVRIGCNFRASGIGSV